MPEDEDACKGAAVDAVFQQGLRRWFGVIFWFAVLGVAGAFLVDVRLGITAWLAAAAHEVPQELGDFGVLIHGGWSKRACPTW